jgi:hypothetical protein
MSFESVESGLLVEGGTYGFDIDTNYRAVKIEVGLNIEFLRLSVFWGNYWANHAPLGNVGSTANIRDRIGNEVDIRLNVRLRENVHLGIAAAFLFQSDFFPGLVRERNQLDPNLPAERGHLQRSQLIILSLKVKF